ncbi:MAG: tRNA lysidine(34) synthetase TilS [Acidimicrobiales bacterium]
MTDRRRKGGPSAATAVELLGRCTFPVTDQPVSCAVSGGADSLALLVLARAAGLSVTAIHVDHGLRPGSSVEADLVRAAAQRFGAAFESHTLQVAAGANLEARARAARYQVLPPEVLTGHTAEDRAETMLLNLLRGSGGTGLAALTPSQRRPLLGLRRHETVGLCEQLGLVPFEDPTNREPRFKRNRVRAELLPLMSDIADRDVVPLLTRLGDHLAEVEALLADGSADLDPTSVDALRTAHPALVRAALRSWLRQAGGPEQHPPDRAALARVMSVVDGSSRATDVGSGWRVVRREGRLSLEEPDVTLDQRKKLPVRTRGGPVRQLP